MKRVFSKAIAYSGGIILLVSISVLGLAGRAEAASTGLSIQPLKISHTLNPGEEVSGAIQITNASDSAVQVQTKVEDFIPLAGTYNIQIVERAPGVSTVRDWITLNAPKAFPLAKGEAKSITYAIKAPANAEPGGHFGVALFKANELVPGNQQLKVGTQVGMLVLVTIPGSHLEKGRILDFSGPTFVQTSPINFTIKFENTGTVHFEPKGTLAITNIFGKEIGQVAVGGQVVLPTGIKDLVASVNFDGTLLGRYKAHLKMFDGEGSELTADSLTFYAFPVWYVVAFLMAVAGLFLGIRLISKKINFSISLKR